MKHENLCNHPGTLVLRLVVGGLFLIHGVQKWALWLPGAGATMEGGMLLIMKALSIIEPLAGLALIAGVWMRWAAAALAAIMVGAIYFKIMVFKVDMVSKTGTGWEFDLLLFAASIAIFLLCDKLCIEEAQEKGAVPSPAVGAQNEAVSHS